MFKCPYCQSKLKNASFSESKVFVYLTCVDCYKKVILMKEEYQEFLRIYDAKNSKINRWLE